MKEDEYAVLICSFCGAERVSKLTKFEYNCHKCHEPIIDAVIRSRKRDADRKAKAKVIDDQLHYIMTGKRR